MDQLLEQFLQQRGIADDIIERMKTEKIDAEAILAMGSSALKEFIPTTGDVHAVIAFCSRTLRGESSTSKESLVDKLKRKLLTYNNDKKKKKDKDSDVATSHKKKLSRKVHLGWINDGIQVRTRYGGGTRLVEVLRTDTKQHLLEKAIKLFFPNGTSSKGPLDNFICDMVDFERKTFEDQLSVQNIFDITELSNLRFYLTTTKKPGREVTATVTADSEFNNTINSTNAELTHGEAISQIKLNNDNVLSEFILFGQNQLQFQNPPDLDVYQSNLLDFNGPDTVNDTLKLVLHRGHVYEELTREFEVINCDQVPAIQVEIISSNGKTETAVDIGGVFRDILTEFWNTFYIKRCEGTVLKIPVITHLCNGVAWITIAKIFFVGYKQVKYFPHKLPRPFMEYAIFQNSFSNLTDSFLNLIGQCDANVLRQAIHDFKSVDPDELTDVLDVIKCKKIVNADNIEQVLQEIAHAEMIQKPKFILDAWHTILRKFIFSQSTLDDIYVNKKITNKNVINLLNYAIEEDSISPESKEKMKGFLKKILREAEVNVLERFLRFCTGSDVIVENYIEINFNNVSNIQRCPVGYTCTCALELSVNYDTYVEFKEEMMNVVMSDMWSMDIA